MEGDVEFVVSLGFDDKLNEFKELLNEIVEMLVYIIIIEKFLKCILSFLVNCFGEEIGIIFVGIFLGYEFNFLVLVIL